MNIDRFNRDKSGRLVEIWHEDRQHLAFVPTPLPPKSAFFEKHRQEYYDLLLAVTERGMWHEWVLFFLRGVAEQAADAVARAKRLQELQLDWRKRLTDMRAPAMLLGNVDKFFDHPVITIPDVQNLLAPNSYNTARRYVQKLLEAHILTPVQDVGYGKLYRASEILELFLT